MRVIVDLDGTLALIDHRRHLVGPGAAKQDWTEFYARCSADLPNTPVIELVLALVAAGHRVEIWSGRSDEVAFKTKAWLRRHGLDELPLRMRKRADYTSDHQLKQQWLQQAVEAGDPPQLVIDDRAKVVAMWRANNITCAQVAPGDF